MDDMLKIGIKEIHAKVICPTCKGKVPVYGCHACADKGYTKEWIPFIDLVYELAHKMAEEDL